MSRIFLSPPHMSGAEMKYIDEAFASNWIAPLGKNVEVFEKRVCEFVGAEHGVALSSGTAAIHLALMALGVTAGDDVICSDVTFSGSCNPIAYLGANPVFIDSDEESWCMCPKALETALAEAKHRGKLPKAAVIVDLYGLPACYDRLLDLCTSYGVPVIEDAAEALGAVYKDRKCGTFGDISVFSFNGNKIITTSGGGMAVSQHKEYVEKMLFWATQSREPAVHYEHREIGYNYRLSNICAGIGAGQMEYIQQFVDARTRINHRYRSLLSHLPVTFAPAINGAVPNNWLTVIQLEPSVQVTPGDIMEALEKHNIEARPFWKPMHCQPVFSSCRFVAEHAEAVGVRLFERGLCLPSGSALTDEQQDFTAEIICGVFKK